MAVQLSYMNIRVAIVSAILMALTAGCKTNSNPAVDFMVTPLDSKDDVRLSKEYKDKAVVVYMWATWCGPCKQFAPTLNDIAAKYQPKGIPFLAISSESKEIVKKSELKEPHKMTVMLDTLTTATEALGADALPTLVVLDREHRPLWGTKGIGPTTEANLRAILDGLN
jgi:thiol-disulfide isomerase/thioredoxin